jgi:hypothetical protein
MRQEGSSSPLAFDQLKELRVTRFVNEPMQSLA